ncbi:MAG TPA: HIT domain-containing protein [Gammaproteobacteria bacterium]|nr:HIT domain-containing protein [Gammaproteobacteria bacterium]
MDDPGFTLHPRLATDCVVAGDLPLSRVLVFDDVRYPWLLLVPRRPGLVEVIDLEAAAQQQLWEESARVSAYLRDMCQVDKINIGAIGNLVPQLHVHHVGRFSDDPAWPAPVWGHSAAVPHTPGQMAQRLKGIHHWFGNMLRTV